MGTKPTQDPWAHACPQAVKRYLARNRQGLARNVVGVGLGYKNGKAGDGLALRYFVERKISDKSCIGEQYLLDDPTGAGLSTDVQETGRLTGYHKVGPGGTLGLILGDAPNVNPMALGTLGAVVKKGKQAFILGSNHALAFNGRVPEGTPLFARQWREFVNGTEHVVARLTETVLLDRLGDNQVDCALAEITDVETVRIGDQVEPVDVTHQDRVYKETDRGKSSGRITDTGVTLDVDFSFGTFRFTDVLLIEGRNGRFATPGDSGALVFDEKTKRPAAMIIGGSDTHVAACKLTTVMAVVGGSLHVGRH